MGSVFGFVAAVAVVGIGSGTYGLERLAFFFGGAVEGDGFVGEVGLRGSAFVV